MRSAWTSLAVVPFLLFGSTRILARQASQTPANPVSDPQAVAVVQAAITALGGATAISQPQSWTFQAQMQGSHANGVVNYVISTDTDPGKVIRPDGTAQRARLVHSHFLPALVGAILLEESKDPQFCLLYAGTSSTDAKPVTTVIVAIDAAKLPAQIWTFDQANLPVRIDFRLPARLGARETFPIVVGLSDYQAVSGVLYPFEITSFLPGGPSGVITLQSVTTGLTIPPNEFNAQGGDLR